MSEEVQAADSLLRENADLRAELLSRAKKDAEDTHRLQTYCDSLFVENADLRARMAALVEACEATAAFIESYGPDTALAQYQPTFYSLLRVYGKNARAAVAAVRPQADALLSELKAARAVVRATRSMPNSLMMDALEAYDKVMKARSG